MRRCRSYRRCHRGSYHHQRLQHHHDRLQHHHDRYHHHCRSLLLLRRHRKSSSHSSAFPGRHRHRNGQTAPKQSWAPSEKAAPSARLMTAMSGSKGTKRHQNRREKWKKAESRRAWESTAGGYGMYRIIQQMYNGYRTNICVVVSCKWL